MNIPQHVESVSCPDCGNADPGRIAEHDVIVEDASREVWAEEGVNTVCECQACGYTQYRYAFEDINQQDQGV